MIRAIVQSHPWLLPVFFLLGLALAAGMFFLARRLVLPRGPAVLLGLALAAELTATFYPMHPGAGAPGVCTLNRDLLTPLTGQQGWMNIIMFIPVAFFAATTFRRHALPLAGSILLSGTTELLQALTPHTGRACTSEDVVANTLGAAIGVGLAATLHWLHSRRAPKTTEPAPVFSRTDLARSGTVLAIGGAVLTLAAVATVTPVFAEVGELTRPSSAQQQVAEKTVRTFLGEDAAITAVQYTEGPQPGSGDLMITLKNSFLQLSWPDQERISWWASTPAALPGVPERKVTTDQDAVRQATAFVRTHFPRILKDGRTTVHPTADDARSRTVAWRQRIDGVLMPLRMDVIVEPDGKISTFLVRDQKPPAGIPAVKLDKEEAVQVAEEHTRGQKITGTELLVEKNRQGKWETRWAVDYAVPAPPENESPSETVTITVLINATTGKYVETSHG
ncbi:VanZ family protein [Streptomyces sp. NPDC059506]|uniref:VanZ family protein n=1 Tax=unclassified Streptomyces TaxID=2593676 RepID=UPI0022AA43D6|nr:VanZ family protein [Streptomyces sp. HB2AG]MCZ2524638.1 VanZ family protein [Streptomyces sp. HB2AG]